jgi:hypothetical protein
LTGQLGMDIRYYIDPENDAPHIYWHSVSEAEVEEVLRRPGEAGLAPTIPE